MLLLSSLSRKAPQLRTFELEVGHCAVLPTCSVIHLLCSPALLFTCTHVCARVSSPKNRLAHRLPPKTHRFAFCELFFHTVFYPPRARGVGLPSQRIRTLGKSLFLPFSLFPEIGRLQKSEGYNLLKNEATGFSHVDLRVWAIITFQALPL